ncbi:hypothetical protein CPC08DRAFT_698513 [Agrocybe pediades]|nr:hypothetical protein CPC08DRAFT_698513 [Agrocybe pediades]
MEMDLQGQWVGPMPIKKFLEQLLDVHPPAHDQEMCGMPPQLGDDFFKSALYDSENKRLYETERGMYSLFIDKVNESKVLHGMQLIDTSSYSVKDATTGMKNKPDTAMYQADFVTNTRLMHFEHLEGLFELKPSDKPCDPFEDSPLLRVEDIPTELLDCTSADELQRRYFETEVPERRLCREQLVSYARQWCSRQPYRTHCFVVWIGDPWARIIRMDRTGGIVSKRFNFLEEGQLLVEFLWRYSHATPEVRGVDTSVRRASEEESVLAEEKLAEWIAPAVLNETRRDVFKLDVPTEDSSGQPPRQVLVWGSSCDPSSVTGRAMRGYPGYDLTTREIVFLKDAWRSSEPGATIETDILRTLDAAQVCNVPKLLCGGDLDGRHHETLTKSFADEAWNVGCKSSDLVQRRHVRFIVDFVGDSLLSFRSSHHMVEVVYDAFKAHREAYEKCGILHRDISPGNILISRRDGRGFLIDWDLAKTIAACPSGIHRAGTWQFMSMTLLSNPRTGLHIYQDDLESFFWVIQYVSMRFQMNNLPTSRLSTEMARIFDSMKSTPDGVEGGFGKMLYMRLLPGGQQREAFVVLENEPLTDLIESFRRVIRSYKLAEVEYYFRKEGKEEEGRECDEPTFRSLLTYPIVQKLFDDALLASGWPESDVARDRLPGRSM